MKKIVICLVVILAIGLIAIYSCRPAVPGTPSTETTNEGSSGDNIGAIGQTYRVSAVTARGSIRDIKSKQALDQLSAASVTKDPHAISKLVDSGEIETIDDSPLVLVLDASALNGWSKVRIVSGPRSGDVVYFINKEVVYTQAK
jgi:hypothetical protein